MVGGHKARPTTRDHMQVAGLQLTPELDLNSQYSTTLLRDSWVIVLR